ncbi:hypothetical protein GCM10022248_88810 [Nonomuraea soli]
MCEGLSTGQAEGMNETKQLRRTQDGRIIAGVCSGVGQYLGIDPNIIRIGLGVLTLFGGAGIAAYAIGWLLLPEEGRPSIVQDLLNKQQSKPQEPWHETTTSATYPPQPTYPTQTPYPPQPTPQPAPQTPPQAPQAHPATEQQAPVNTTPPSYTQPEQPTVHTQPQPATETPDHDVPAGEPRQQ